MNIGEFKDFIDKQNKWAEETECFDIAIFRCWIQFEKFIIDKFIQFSTQSFVLEDIRKLKFDNEEHFKAFLRGDRTYIEYISKIEILSKHIFQNDKNPFDILISDQKYSNVFRQLRAIRNHIAHESEESSRKYTRIVFAGNASKVKSPNAYLSSWNDDKKESNYTFYIRSLKEMSDLIEEPPFIPQKMAHIY